VTDDQAIELVAAALLLTRQGKRNAFAQLLKDRDDSQDANTVTWFGDGRLKEIMARRNVSEDRAQRIIRRGKQLVGATKSNPMEDD